MNESTVVQPVPLRVMEVIYCFEIGGSERLAAMLARHMSMNGISASVCATHTGKGPISVELESEGIRCFAMNSESRSRVGIRYALYSLFKREKPDVLHIHHVPMFRLCYWPAKLAGVSKMVLTEHTDYEIRNIRTIHRMAKTYCPRADFVTVVHEEMRRYFVSRLNVKRERIATVYNGVDTDHYRPGFPDVQFRKSLGLDEDTVVLGWVGRLHEDKDLGNLIGAFRKLLDTTNAKVVLLIIGDGPERNNLESLIRNSSLDGAVHLLGERKDIEYLLNNFDILVLSSKTEGVPLVILEAMSAGVPIVATAVGGVGEVITEDMGIVVPPGDRDQLADGMRRLVLSKAERERLGMHGREIALQKFNLDCMLKTYMDIVVNR